MPVAGAGVGLEHLIDETQRPVVAPEREEQSGVGDTQVRVGLARLERQRARPLVHRDRLVGGGESFVREGQVEVRPAVRRVKCPRPFERRQREAEVVREIVVEAEHELRVGGAGLELDRPLEVAPRFRQPVCRQLQLGPQREGRNERRVAGERAVDRLERLGELLLDEEAVGPLVGLTRRFGGCRRQPERDSKRRRSHLSPSPSRSR